ncbi:MAG: hypothetical protein A2297_06585 [Elusimicrobia bacterium RIFOXYB2_FULL_48_7]|nr:MAG: hypothetical protein A2297_06585 [Elusimicrobia bacterium RIFOXYB2_FULL_48_7]
MIKLLSFVILVTLVFSGSLSSEEGNKGNIGVNINYPGVGVKYFWKDKIALELRGQSVNDEGVEATVYGLRGYKYFKTIGKIETFAGLELDYATFKTENSNGNGYVAELFAGGEYAFARNLSVQMDIGPALVNLTDTSTALSNPGMEYVVNFGINYYFGGISK